jgi:hypothetical protein
MQTFALPAALALALAGSPVLAQESQTAPGYGKPDCRIVAVSPAPTGAVTWTGGCKDGFADGPGTLSWQDAGRKTVRLEGKLAHGEVDGEATLTFGNGGQYSGTFKNGIPDGKGYFRDPDGAQYEGDVREGERTGTGAGVSPGGDSYQGEWRNGMREGRGHMWYSFGGDYDGQWLADKRHGHGILTYVGSGRTFEGEFVEGRIAGTAPAPNATRHYSAFQMKSNMSFMPEVALKSSLPPAVGYDELSAEQKRLFNSYYQALEAGDEPPYPIDGPQPLYELVSALITRLKVSGPFYIYANVGANGKVSTVRMVGVEDPVLRRRTAALVASLKYKPAVCRGQPCAMVYPFAMKLGQNR